LTLGMAIHALKGHVHVDWRVDPERRKLAIGWTERCAHP
jgi:hypothetical protein